MYSFLLFITGIFFLPEPFMIDLICQVLWFAFNCFAQDRERGNFYCHRKNKWLSCKETTSKSCPDHIKNIKKKEINDSFLKGLIEMLNVSLINYFSHSLSTKINDLFFAIHIEANG